MSDDDFDRVFGGHSTRFSERVGRPDIAAPPTAAQEVHVGSGPYKPYGFIPTGTMGETCEVRRWIEHTETPEGLVFQYRFLMQVGFVGEEELRLFLPESIVMIEGRQLSELRHKIARRQATFIQQFSPRVWPTQPPAGEPVIERIQVIRPGVVHG